MLALPAPGAISHQILSQLEPKPERQLTEQITVQP
jgi:hypothetical protein